LRIVCGSRANALATAVITVPLVASVTGQHQQVSAVPLDQGDQMTAAVATDEQITLLYGSRRGRGS
jgi:hypothetical protein